MGTRMIEIPIYPVEAQIACNAHYIYTNMVRDRLFHEGMDKWDGRDLSSKGFDD
jgi:hypothetical protein